MNPKLLTLAIIFIGFAANCQNYSPFNSSAPKRFENVQNSNDNNYYFYPMNTDVNADTLIFTQYVRKLGEPTTNFNPNCPLWGTYAEDADTTWLGRYIKFNEQSEELILKTKNEVLLRFDFGLQLGDSALFYQTVNEEYYLKYSSIAQETFLSQSDSVKSFEINKYDNLGNPMTSSLNGFEVKLGKNLGIVQFIECNQFPTVEKGLQLMGQLNPTIGYYQMTYDEVYPWNVGDTLEVKGVAASTGGVGQEYKLITIQNRVETADSVWIYLNTQVYPSPWFNINYPNPIVYQKGKNVSEFPKDMFLANRIYESDSADFCGLRGRHHVYSTFHTFCDLCNCMPTYDAVGDLFTIKTFRSGLGQTYEKNEYFGGINNTMSYANLIYSNIGGQVCGNFVPLGVEELSLDFSVTPNPVTDQLELNSDSEINKVEILSSSGAQLLTQLMHGSHSTIDVSQLETGVYFVRAFGTDGRIGVLKFIKEP